MNDYSKGRRDFIRKAGAGSALALGLSQIVSETYAAVPTTRISIKNNDIILFQGDSITDAGRNREDKNPNSTRSLGTGYPLLATSELLYGNAGKNIQIYNRGVSGNKVYQLAERWSEDCLDLKPTILSILVGVNDFWHTLKRNYDGTIETYRNDFKALLQKTKEQLPDVKLIIGEPFAVNGVKSVDNDWFPKFYDYQKAAKEVATQFDAVFIPYQSIFDKAMKSAPGSYWTGDGVHPSLAGAQLMAHAWLKAVGS